MQRLHHWLARLTARFKPGSTNQVDKHHVWLPCINQSVMASLGHITKMDKNGKMVDQRRNLPVFCLGDSDEPSRHLVVSTLNNAQSRTLKFNSSQHSLNSICLTYYTLIYQNRCSSTEYNEFKWCNSHRLFVDRHYTVFQKETSVFEFHFSNSCCSEALRWILLKFATFTSEIW